MVKLSAVTRVVQEVLLKRGDAVSEVTAEQILDGALAEFADYGLRRTSMDSVARRAGVNRVTIYRHFGNKDDLVRAVVVRQARRLLGRLFAAADPGASIEETLPELFVLGLRLFREERIWQRLLATEPELVLPLLTTQSGPLVAALREIIAAQLRVEHGRRGRDLDGLAEVITRVALSFALNRDSYVDLDDAAKARAFARNVLVPIWNSGR